MKLNFTHWIQQSNSDVSFESEMSLNSPQLRLAGTNNTDALARTISPFVDFTECFVSDLQKLEAKCKNLELHALCANVDIDQLVGNEWENQLGAELRELQILIFQRLDEHLLDLKDLTNGYDQTERQNTATFFRSRIYSFIQQSPFWKRVLEKPRGYAGDSEMMRMIYENRFAGPTLLGKFLHKHGVGRPAAQAVRNRRVMIPEAIRDITSEFNMRNLAFMSSEIENRETDHSNSQLRILSVACGPAWEMRDLALASTSDFSNFQYYFLDQDAEALSEARSGMEEIEKNFNRKLDATYVRGSIKKLIENSSFCESLGKFDFIYSMGLFDYLPDSVAARLIRVLNSMLRPHGQLIIGNYHISNPDILYMEYWGDWKLLHRDEEQFLKMVPSTNDFGDGWG